MRISQYFFFLFYVSVLLSPVDVDHSLVAYLPHINIQYSLDNIMWHVKKRPFNFLATKSNNNLWYHILDTPIKYGEAVGAPQSK